MRVTLVDETGRTIGDAVLNKVKLRACEEKPYAPPRHNESWGQFEDENLKDAFQLFVSDRAMKAGRTEGAIMSRLRRFMPGTWS